MATDKSELKLGAILKVGVGSVLALVLIRVGMVSYFDDTAADIRAEQTATMQHPEKSRANAAASALTMGPMPIDKAMQVLSNTAPNRQGMAGIEPKPSNDMSAVTTCWAQMKCDAGALFEDSGILDVDASGTAAQNGDAAAPGAGSADAGPKLHLRLPDHAPAPPAPPPNHP